MPDFEYIAKDRRSATLKGQEFASSERELINALRKRGLIVLSVKEVKKGSFRSRDKLKTFELSVFFKQLSTMVKGGLPLVGALEALEGESKNPVLKRTLQQIISYIHEGHSFSDGLKRFPHIFSNLVCTIAESGEKIGSLDTMLERLSMYLDASDRLTRKVISSLIYPIIIIVFFIVLMLGITLFLIPRFKSAYEGFGVDLPGLTTTVFGMSDFVVDNSVFIFGTVFILGFVLHRYFFTTKKGKHKFDGFTLRIPLFGKIITNAIMGKFCKTFSILQQEGVPVTEAIELSSRTSNNLVIQEAGRQVSKMINQGQNINSALKNVNIFPSLLVQMSMVGEESGNLPELLDKTADFYEDQVDAFIGVLLSLLEPVLLVLMGMGFGLVALALYLPMFKIGEVVTR